MAVRDKIRTALAYQPSQSTETPATPSGVTREQVEIAFKELVREWGADQPGYVDTGALTDRLFFRICLKHPGAGASTTLLEVAEVVRRWAVAQVAERRRPLDAVSEAERHSTFRLAATTHSSRTTLLDYTEPDWQALRGANRLLHDIASLVFVGRSESEIADALGITTQVVAAALIALRPTQPNPAPASTTV